MIAEAVVVMQAIRDYEQGKLQARAITLTLPYPISANRYWASRVIKAKATGKWMAMTYVTPEAKAYREQCAWAASRVIKQPFSGRIQLEAQLYPHRPLDWSRRVRKLGATWDDTVQCIDLGNAEKVMSDALQGIVFADDCMYRRIVLDRMEPDEQGARLVVTITPLALAANPQGQLPVFGGMFSVVADETLTPGTAYAAAKVLP